MAQRKSSKQKEKTLNTKKEEHCAQCGGTLDENSLLPSGKRALYQATDIDNTSNSKKIGKW